MKNIINFFVMFFKQRAYKISTIIALLFTYLLIFYHQEFTSFIQFLFNDALRKFVENLVNNDTFVTGIAGGLIAYLIGTKKF